MYMFLCSAVVKYVLTRRAGSKSFNMNHSQRTGFSDSELPGKIVQKSRKHVLQCASVSRNIAHAGHVPSIDSVPSIRSNKLIRYPSVVYQRIGPIREPPPCFALPRLAVWIQNPKKNECCSQARSHPQKNKTINAPRYSSATSVAMILWGCVQDSVCSTFIVSEYVSRSILRYQPTTSGVSPCAPATMLGLCFKHNNCIVLPQSVGSYVN